MEYDFKYWIIGVALFILTVGSTLLCATAGFNLSSFLCLTLGWTTSGWIYAKR